MRYTHHIVPANKDLCAYLAWVPGLSTPVGMFGHFFRDGVLHANGTWVHPEYRRQGIGEKLWHRALKSHQVREVKVLTSSTSGTGLVKKLQRAYPRIDWSTQQYRYYGDQPEHQGGNSYLQDRACQYAQYPLIRPRSQVDSRLLVATQ